MTEREAKILAAELESSKYWRVESIGPEEPEQFTGKPCCTVIIRHRHQPGAWTVTGLMPPESVAQWLRAEQQQLSDY